LIRYYITDRRALRTGITLLDVVQRMAEDETFRSDSLWLQIREKDLTAKELCSLVQAVRISTSRLGIRLLVNTRVDVAVAADADGVHLPSGSPPPQRWREAVPKGFLIGVSCHNMQEVAAAEQAGADYVVFGPIFAPLSKSSDLEPRGLELLRQAASSVHIPVLALGGVTRDNAQACCEAGAAGVAGIAMFQNLLDK
jgi:thiamine-phosphate pyrophosphorylase